MSMMEILAKEWVQLFRLNPRLTSAVSGLVIALVAGGITHLEQADRDKRESRRLENQNYQQQIDQLNATEKNIRQLLAFVNFQQNTLRETEDAILRLESEREKLRPLVESDREVVEALFFVQEERFSKGVWRERFIGFGFGVLASLVASFVWFSVGLLIKGWRSNG